MSPSGYDAHQLSLSEGEIKEENRQSVLEG